MNLRTLLWMTLLSILMIGCTKEKEIIVTTDIHYADTFDYSDNGQLSMHDDTIYCTPIPYYVSKSKFLKGFVFARNYPRYQPSDYIQRIDLGNGKSIRRESYYSGFLNRSICFIDSSIVDSPKVDLLTYSDTSSYGLNVSMVYHNNILYLMNKTMITLIDISDFHNPKAINVLTNIANYNTTYENQYKDSIFIGTYEILSKIKGKEVKKMNLNLYNIASSNYSRVLDKSIYHGPTCFPPAEVVPDCKEIDYVSSMHAFYLFLEFPEIVFNGTQMTVKTAKFTSIFDNTDPKNPVLINRY